MNYLPRFKSTSETEQIINFLKKTFATQKKDRAVIGVSGGIDSAVCLHLLSHVLPKENIIPVYLPFFDKELISIKHLSLATGIPESCFQTKSIKITVEQTAKDLGLDLKSTDQNQQIRIGNIMSRTRMIFLFDIAKKNSALVCGTENRSENLLGYFTRFGDAASDIEPIAHLYKTQVYDIASYLKISPEIINQPPSAGLWEEQTDEKQLGFSYQEADQVLYLYFEKKYQLQKIISLGFKKAELIISHSNLNSFKHEVPYKIVSLV